MSNSSAFKKAYQKLNAKQKLAVDTIYGPTLVIAGPGTGKTQILALRIGNILLTAAGAKPDEILALTYTDSAVATLRTRLAEFIGSVAYRVRIHTFHGFARSILELRPDLFPRIALGVHLSEVRGIALVEQLLDLGSYTKIRSPKNPHRAAKELLYFMGKLKQEHYTPERYLAELTEQHKLLLSNPDRVHTTGAYNGQEKGGYLRRRERIEKHLEAALLFAAYQEALEREALYDYEDLINEAIHGLETDEGFRAEVGERSQFVLADEHQDANPAQNRLLELVTDFDGAPNLFIVGDEKQAIYRFQGASLSSFFYLKEKYVEAKVISLDKNYRSTAQILKTSHDLIAPAPVPDPALRPLLVAVRGEGGQILEAVCDTPRKERETICAYIEKLHEANVPYDAIAVLMKRNADVLVLAEVLRGAGIPEDHASADINALTHPAVLLFIELLRATADLSQDVPLSRALFMPGIPVPLIERLRLLALPRTGESLIEKIRKNGTSEICEWLQRLEKLAEDMPATPLMPWLTRLAFESGFIAGVFTLKESESAYEAYQGLMDEAVLLAKQNYGATALDFLQHLTFVEKHELKIRRPRTKRTGVHIMTVHGAKGLEFPHIIIAHATDEHWMRGRTDEFSLLIGKEGDENDERRLLYVALTRAKDDVLVTRSEVTEEGRAQTPLRFLADISSHLTQANFPSKVPAMQSYEAHTVLDPFFLKERLLAHGFSPTSFNNYMLSPWQYYFRTLLRLPGVSTLPMHLGTAIHAGLKVYADNVKKGQTSIEDAIIACKSELFRLPLTPIDRDVLAVTGESTLRAYLAKSEASMKDVRESEFLIKTTLSVPGLGEIPLTGRLDRLDVRDDGTVEVIDYKTGKARSENDIRGLTKSSDGGYYRQLVFYKLLLKKDGRYTMNKGALHFVEPDGRGNIVIRRFTITDAEVVALETEIVKAAQAIASGSAFAEDCNPSTCDYCDLAELLIVQ